jgi:hypothetical protein
VAESKSSTKSDAPVAARAQHDELTGAGGSGVDAVEERAKDQEKLQRDELKAGESGGETKDGPTIAHNRAPVGAREQGVQGGLVDGMTRRDVSDALEGHFVTIDRTHKDLDDKAKDALPEEQDGYGVYLTPAAVDDDGYPTSAVVRLRDDTNALVTVPYDSLRPALAGRR